MLYISKQLNFQESTSYGICSFCNERLVDIKGIGVKDEFAYLIKCQNCDLIFAEAGDTYELDTLRELLRNQNVVDRQDSDISPFMRHLKAIRPTNKSLI